MCISYCRCSRLSRDKEEQMANVTRNWIDSNVKSLYCFGGQITHDNYKEYIVGIKTLQTTLTAKAIRGEVEINGKFHILIPGVGWADCFFKEE